MKDTEVRLDPFTLEIIKNALVAAGDEMFVALQRTAKSTVIYETLDYACGLTDATGQLISQGNGVTGFLGCLTFAVKAVLDKFGVGDIHPGDLFITNDPYGGGGTHLSDVSLIQPIFADGRLLAFAANKAHWTEVGGKDPGSWTTDATEVYQEGLQFPCVRLVEGGKIVQALVDLLAANVRTPDATLGDMWAGIAANRVGERRLAELCARYGTDVVERSIARLLADGEVLARAAMRALPKGSFEAEDFIDDDGIGNGPFPVRVTVTITDDRFICDFTGTHAQVPGPVNCGRTALLSGARTIFKALLGPEVPVNEGVFRPLEVICPDGTIFTAGRPAPVSTYWETMAYVTDLVWKAMAGVLPEDRLTAGHFLSVCGVVVAGNHPETGELFLLVEPQAGGWGAGRDKDGESGLVCSGDGETYVVPAEVAETRYGFLVDRYELSPEGGGDGRYRGGLGLVRDYRITSDEAYLTATFGRFKFLPWGMNGGSLGSRNWVEIIRKDGTRDMFGKTARYRLEKGDVARLHTATGGGYGHPFGRAVEQVLEDVKNGYVTRERAESVYGVRVDEAGTFAGLTPERARAEGQPELEGVTRT
jgi:N-methylhydantoinase B